MLPSLCLNFVSSKLMDGFPLHQGTVLNEILRIGQGKKDIRGGGWTVEILG